MNLFNELKRRNVFRVGIAYGVAAWVLLQVADLVLEAIEAPDWVLKALLLVVALGFVAALVVAWAYEITPEGIKRERDIDRSQSITAQTGRKLDRIIIAFLAVAVALLLADRYLGTTEPAEHQATVQTAGNATAAANPPAATPAAAAASEPAKSVAVLPFEDLSQAGDMEWFADGLAEEILDALSHTPDLLVSSRTSSFRFKGSDLDISQIAKELGVAHVLEGSVRAVGDRLRVTAQLIRASDGFHIWSESYDRDKSDMISIQEDLATHIAQALETSMDPAALAEMTRVGTSSVEAYQAYLQGLSLVREATNKADLQAYRNAAGRFQKASELDPHFAAARLQAANLWKDQLDPTSFFRGALGLSSPEVLQRFNTAIEAAIENAPTAIDRQGYEAQLAQVELRLRDAMRLYQAYLKERPNDDTAWFGLLSVAQEGFDQPLIDEALAHSRERGQQLADQASLYLSTAYQYAPTGEVADYGLAALQRWPTYPGLLYQVHRALMWAGRAREGAELALRYGQTDTGHEIVSARQACIEGRRDEVERILAGLDRESDPTFQIKQWLILKMLGRDQEATESLQRFAAKATAHEMAFLLQYRVFDPRPFPQLMAVLKRERVQVQQPLELPYRCPAPEGDGQ